MNFQTTDRLATTAREFQRLNELLAVLMDDLNERMAEPEAQQTSNRVIAIVDEMLENLDQQSEMAAANDYLAEVLERFPNWHPQVEHLRQQSALLKTQLYETRDRLLRDAEKGGLALEARRQLKDWVETYQEHRRRETALVLDAFTLEVGEGE